MPRQQYTAYQMLVGLQDGTIQPASMQREYCQHAIALHQRALADALRDGLHEQADVARNEVAIWTARLEAAR